MSAASTTQAFDTSPEPDPVLRDDLPESLTLLELVYAISAVSEDDQVVVDTIVALLASGRVRLRGNCRGDPIEDFEV
jgi:hypothetical protein